MSSAETTPLLQSKWHRISSKWIVLQSLFLFIITIILSYILLIFNQPKTISKSTNFPLNLDSKSFKSLQLSSMIPAIASIGYNYCNVIKQKEFNYSNPKDYIHKNEYFADYESFKKYGMSIKHKKNMITKGIFNIIENISQWIIISSNRTIKSFESRWQFVESTQFKQKIISILQSETTFSNKQFIEYLLYLLNNEELNNTILVSMTDTFGNTHFDGIDIKQILQQGIDSFGGGIGFGLQIYCDDILIFDGGAGGGGGYNTLDKPNIFEYGGGGGIQINNICIGGGTGFETNKFIFDPNTNYKQFYDIELPYFKRLFVENKKCDMLRMLSGGGSGAGFTVYNKTNLVLWSYYYLDFTAK